MKFVKTVILRILSPIYNHPLLLQKRQESRLTKILSDFYSYPHQPASKKFMKIALIVRDGTTYPKSSAFIRLIAPLTHKATSHKLSVKISSENTTEPGSDIDVCIVQRTAFDSVELAQQFVGNLRASNTSLVVDTDDAFSAIDASHPEHGIHSSRLEALNYILNKADQVWVSSPLLAKTYAALNKSVIVVPNSLDERVWAMPTHNHWLDLNPDRPLELLYMGTVSHDADFAMIMPALDKVAENYPNSFKLTVIGVSTELPERPWLKRLYQKRGGAIYPYFVRWFLNQGPFDVGLSPLLDTPFNRNKSDIKCLDYIASAILPVVSDLEAYNSPELDDYIIRAKNTPKAWESAISELVVNPNATRHNIARLMPKAQKYLWHRRSSSATAKQLLRLLESLRKSN